MTKLPDATGIKAKIEGKTVTGSFPAIKGKAISNITFNGNININTINIRVAIKSGILNALSSLLSNREIQ